MKFNLWWLVLIVLGVGLLGFIGFRIWEKQNKLKTDAAQRAMRGGAAVTVTAVPAKLRDIVGIFTATGTLEAPENVKIAAKVSGRITYLQVQEGDKVKQGQVLARLDAADLQAGVDQAQANLAQARYRLAQAEIATNSNSISSDSQLAAQQAAVNDADNRVNNSAASLDNAGVNLDAARETLNRQQQLFDQGFISAQALDNNRNAVKVAEGQLRSATAANKSAQAQLQQAQAALETAKANNQSSQPAYLQSVEALKSAVAAAAASVSSARAKLNDTVLTSPLDGVVTDRLLDKGAIASAGQAILAVQFINSMWVTISVPENVVLKTSIGQEVQVALDALPGKSFTATIIQINPAADAQSRQFTVRAILNNTQGQFKPGMFAKVTVETDRVTQVVTVPQEAVETDKDGNYAFIVTADNLAERRPIVIGVSDSTYTEVKSGLKAGDTVVTISASTLRDGAKVNAGGGGGPGGGKGGGKGGSSATVKDATASSTTSEPVENGKKGQRKPQ